MEKLLLKKNIEQPEGRRFEIKKILPTKSNIAKTVVAFANDAGGVILIGIEDEPRKVVGLSEKEILQTEEQISSIIHDSCYPTILPDISFVTYEDKKILKIEIFKGSKQPYYIKSKGKENGTFIRVGSTNRLASKEIIEELERRSGNIAYDSEICLHKTIERIDLTSFKKLFKKETNENLTISVLDKLNLFKEEQGAKFPVNALVLLSDDKIRTTMFPYAKIECARFKGTGVGTFIDQKTIDEQVGLQAEFAYKFVLRHINKGATFEGVYRKDEWEYPVVAIREVLRNAVIHRDYSLAGKDIKVAIFDDRIEITSPGLLPPSIDYGRMKLKQSDIKNKVLAPIFKKIGIIEQWGNGLSIIAEEIEAYPDISFKWETPGLSFRVIFRNNAYKNTVNTQEINSNILENIERKSEESRNDVGMMSERIQNDFGREILNTYKILIDNPHITANEVADKLGKASRTIERYLKVLKDNNIVIRKGSKLGGYWEIQK